MAELNELLNQAMAIRDEFWNIAVSIRKEFTGSVDGTGAALMQLIQPPDNGIDWLDVGSSLMKAVQYALGWLIVWIGGLIQLPMMIVQFVMECLCYLFLPIALSLFAFESTKGLAIRYIQQTLAILAWPIGFAVVDLVGYSLLTSSTSVVSAGALAAGLATGFTPAKLVIGGIVAVWLILGSLVTPIVMQMLFCSGTPMSSAVGAAIQMGLGFAGASRLMPKGGGGEGAPAQSSSPASSNGAASNPPPSSPSSPALPYSPRGPIAPSSSSPLSPLPSGSNGLIQSPRGSLAVGQVADRISPQQAQSFANSSGTPFTQAFSNGSVVTHQPAVSRVPAASSFIAPLSRSITSRNPSRFVSAPASIGAPCPMPRELSRLGQKTQRPGKSPPVTVMAISSFAARHMAGATIFPSRTLSTSSSFARRTHDCN